MKLNSDCGSGVGQFVVVGSGFARGVGAAAADVGVARLGGVEVGAGAADGMIVGVGVADGVDGVEL